MWYILYIGKILREKIMDGISDLISSQAESISSVVRLNANLQTEVMKAEALDEQFSEDYAEISAKAINLYNQSL